MPGNQARASLHAEIAASYQRFADQEARSRSALYELLARAVATDAEVLARLAELPPPKRQPNLLLAAARHVAGTPDAWGAFRQTILGHWEAVRAIMLERSTQANEPGRCAVLLPVLARLPQPLALIEVGASAGLCLLPDRYAYDDGEVLVHPVTGWTEGARVFPCRAGPATPLPKAPPCIVWRAGMDLNPLDVTNSEEMGWLETLVWPGQEERLARLRAAVAVARSDPPRLVRGDLRHDLAALAAAAPKGATRVVFHTAVLAYVPDPAEREAFASSVSALCDFWISNEGPRVLPNVAARAVEATAPRCRFLLAVNGMPVAWTDPHGAALDWIRDVPARGG